MKIRVGVFFGGKSVEHEVSVISALQAIASIPADKYEVIPVYITKENEFYTGFECSCIEEYSNIPALIKKSTRCTLMNNEGRVQLMRYPFKKTGSNVISEINSFEPHIVLMDISLPFYNGFYWCGELVLSSFEIGTYIVTMQGYPSRAAAGDPVALAYELHNKGTGFRCKCFPHRCLPVNRSIRRSTILHC